MGILAKYLSILQPNPHNSHSIAALMSVYFSVHLWLVLGTGTRVPVTRVAGQDPGTR